MPEKSQAFQQSVEDRIKLRWLVRLRWAALVGQALTIATVTLWQIVQLPVRPLLVLVAIGTAGNIGLELWSRSSRRVPAAGIGMVMIADALLLTAMLAFSGSYSNPFSTLYLVNVALATVLLPPRWAWAVLTASLAGFGSLFALDLVGRSGLHLSDLDHRELMKLHLQGMWVALAIAAIFASVSRASSAGMLSATMPAPARASTVQPPASSSKTAVRISTFESSAPSKPAQNIDPQ